MPTVLEASTEIVAALTVPDLLVLAGGVPDDLVMDRDNDGRVKPYAVVYLGIGQASADRYGGPRPATDVPLDLTVPFQVTAAAGTYEGALWAAEQVRAALTGVQLFDGRTSTRLREDTDPGPIRKDQDVPSDLRWYLPMQYRFATTT